jgi:histidinol-phosphate aminotransferase
MSRIDLQAVIPPNVAALSPYVPGRLIEDVLAEVGLPSAVKLASNENSLGPSPKVLAAVAGALPGLNRYGDADSRALTRAVSAAVGHPAEGIVASNGSSEVILVLCHALLGPGTTAVMSRPSFTLYAKNAQAAGAEVVEIPLDAGFGHDLGAMAASLDGRTRLVFVDNPLNPTGAYLGPEALDRLMAALPPTALLVLDEAYVDFCRSPRPDYAAILATGQAVILRTFSKLAGLAGLRAAYALMDPDLAAVLDKVRQPFNLNNLAQAAAIASLDDRDHRSATLDMTWRALDRLAAELPKLGLAVHPTESNFLMARLPEGRLAEEVVNALLKEGVIIRSLNSFGLPRHVRINAGLPEELDALLAGLEKVLG